MSYVSLNPQDRRYAINEVDVDWIRNQINFNQAEPISLSAYRDYLEAFDNIHWYLDHSTYRINIKCFTLECFGFDLEWNMYDVVFKVVYTVESPIHDDIMPPTEFKFDGCMLLPPDAIYWLYPEEHNGLKNKELK
nr:hypothetical protein CQNTEFLM_CQNTEFLM_CDS_0012 [uncultured phage]